jgi:hypothetical protein
MTELEQMSRLCEQLGAPAAQAKVMATQLLKRAAQIAEERGITREAALKGLLDVVVKGRAGEVPPEFAPPPPRPTRDADK